MKKNDCTEIFAPISLSVLTYFMNLDDDSEQYFSISELQMVTHASYVLLLAALRTLVHCNILDYKPKGRARLYRPNRDSTFLLNFKTLLAGLEEDTRRKLVQQWQT